MDSDSIDYYGILGVDKDATASEIEKKFKEECAKGNNGNDVYDAYLILYNRAMKREYSGGTPQAERIPSYADDDTPEDYLDQLFGREMDDLDRNVYDPSQSQPVVQERRNESDIRNLATREKFRKLLESSGIHVVGESEDLYIWLKSQDGKVNLDKAARHTEISKIAEYEAQAYNEYMSNLDRQIDELLTEPNNNYRLSISKIRYENLVKFLEKRLDIWLSTKMPPTNFSAFRYKSEVASIHEQLYRARQKIKEIEDAIKKYDKLVEENNEPRLSDYFGLSSIDKRIKSDADRLERMSEQIDNSSSSFGKLRTQMKIQKLKIHQQKLLEKRNRVATRMKLNAMRGANYMILVKGFSHSGLLEGFEKNDAFRDLYAESYRESEARRRI